MGDVFEAFDFSALDDPGFKEDAVREEIIAPMLRRLGYTPTGEDRVQRSDPPRGPRKRRSFGRRSQRGD